MDAPENNPQPAVPVLSYQNTHNQPPALGRVIGGALLCMLLVPTSVLFFWILGAIIALSSSDSEDALALVLVFIALAFAMWVMLRMIKRLFGAQPPREHTAL
jgi:protein-S-isoprenylcysteine O-methyltransferase Ste14